MEEYDERHPALIDQELFDRVQSLPETRAISGERRRVHPHYLKGTLFCGRCRLEDQLINLDTKEENLLDLASDGTLPQGKIRARLADIGRQRDKLRTELTTVADDLSDGAEFLQANLKLLEDPHALYMGASDEIRRKLNHAIFKHIFVANEEVVGDEINSPLAELLAVQHGFRA